MKTVTEVKIDKTLVEIKSKRDKNAPSGWSIIAFTLPVRSGAVPMTMYGSLILHVLS